MDTLSSQPGMPGSPRRPTSLTASALPTPAASPPGSRVADSLERRFVSTQTASLHVRRTGGPRYVYVQGELDSPPRLVPLRQGASTVGSRPGVDLRICHPTVSGLHCEIRNHEGRVEVVDRGSKNGVRIQGMRVPATELPVGQTVQLGRVRLLLLDTVPPGSPEGVELLPGVIGASPVMARLAERVQRLAGSSLSVLITGETGTGKELVARALHDLGRRATGPFVPLNCATLPEHLLESELFGHERGAFTGAAGRRRGLFEMASGGTLFLDEVAELPLSQQPKLLRALEQREVRRVGSSRAIAVDVRLVAATLASLPERVAQGRFREDLYYRLSEATVVVPPLSERTGDIPLLVAHFLASEDPPLGASGDSSAEDAGKGRLSPQRLPRELGPLDLDRKALLRRLEALSFPGNVRELRSLVRLAQVLGWEEAIAQRQAHLAAESASGGVVPAVVSPGAEARGTNTDPATSRRPAVSSAGRSEQAEGAPEPAEGAPEPLTACDSGARPHPIEEERGASEASPPATLASPRGASRSLAPVPSSAAPGDPPASAPGYHKLPDLERRLILDALEKAGGNRARAARLLGLPKSTYADRLRRILRAQKEAPG